MRRWKQVGAALAAVLLGMGSVPGRAEVVPVQYGGPMMGGPDDGPPGYGPDMGPGPYGPDGGDVGAGRPRGRAGRIGPFRTYHGFRIDLGEAQGNIDVPSALAEVERQIDIVDRAGLGPSMLERFRAVPIRISVTFAGGGSHYRGGSEVTLGSLQPGDDRPVLLHEYMHVLEYRSFPGGFHNPTVQRFYDEARAGGLYEPGSYMMSNPAEFFAVTASCFLNGTVAREPYTRASIRQRQPDYYAYLQRVFGPHGETASVEPRSRVAAMR